MKQVDSILSTYKKEKPSQVRIEESVVRNFIPEEPRIKPMKSNVHQIKTERGDRPTQPKVNDYMHVTEKKSPDQMNQSKKLKPKVNLAVSPRRVEPSPPNMNVHLHTIQRKH